MGIKEDSKTKVCSVEGIDKEKDILKDFWNTINNKEKISYNILNDDNIGVSELEGKKVIIINIPRANRRNKPIYINNNPMTGTYKRYNAGDFKCTENEVRAMLIDSSEKSKDSVVLEEYNINDIDIDTLKNYRKLFEIHKGDQHKWNLVPDEEFLYLINAMDRKTRQFNTSWFINVWKERGNFRYCSNILFGL